MKAYSQAAVILFVSVVISLGILFSSPELASAQSFWDSVTCTGRDCEMCHFVQLANVIVDWLVRVLLLVFGVVAVVAGFGLVTSAGNPAAKNQAKGRMTNAIIGFLIVLGAWMAVDALLRGLAGDNFGAGGNMAWNKIECVKQPGLSGYSDSFDVLVGAEGWTAIGGNRVEYACADTGLGTYDCGTAVAQCGGANGSAQSNADGSSVICNPKIAVTSGDRGVAQCDPSNVNCSVNVLIAEGLDPTQAEVMSCIAVTENSGKAVGCSGSGPCGTFQISEENWKIFSSGIPGCTAADFGGGYSGLKAAQNNGACNTKVMTKLVDSRGYQPWTGANNGVAWNPAARQCVLNHSNASDSTNRGF